ncbi:MAG: 3-phosphoshikimate 1-carboxyvinyltransferase [Spirochaetaceae bacterium]|nr:3-phosphoshikimate 1-carboxyvinyltransferase [Spirochaetaceae bacterium]
MDIKRMQRTIGGTIGVPSSKSQLQRAIAGGMLAEGVTRVRFSTLCDDAQAALQIVQSLGAKVSQKPGMLEIEGSPRFSGQSGSAASGVLPGELHLSCGESGLCMRMFAPIAALLSDSIVMEGSGSLDRRPMRMVETALPELGVLVETVAGHAPLKLRGPLHGGNLCMDAGDSSQFLTGLLMALPLARENSLISVCNVASRGYLDLTIGTCAQFGIRISKDKEYSQFSISGKQRYQPADITIQGDWSAGAFLVVMAAMAGAETGLRITGLSMDSEQPDKAVVDVACRAGAKISVDSGGLTVEKGKLKAFKFDATDCPDLFPPLAALAVACGGRSAIGGIHRLHGKESNRAETLKDMLIALGGKAWLEQDFLVIEGGRLAGGMVDPRNDHRIAMAAEAASLACDGQVVIRNSECVAKSWPGFFEDMESISL